MNDKPPGTDLDTDLIADAAADRRRDSEKRRGPFFWALRDRHTSPAAEGEDPKRVRREWSITLVEAERPTAEKLIGENRIGRVHDLATPEHIADLWKVDPETLVDKRVDRLPSAWDATDGMTLSDMEDAGFDPF